MVNYKCSMNQQSYTMNNTEIISFLGSFDNTLYKHSSNIKTKFLKFNSLSEDKQEALKSIYENYKVYINYNFSTIGYSEDIIRRRVEALNAYYNFININNYDNIFTSQGKFRPTILEEFMYILFRDLITDEMLDIAEEKRKIKIGGQRAYTNLFFSASNFKDFVESPQIGINQKDQDFAIYRPIKIIVENEVKLANLPVIAIENKTYIDKTMLDGSISTAEKVKTGNPYCLYLIVSENYDVDLKIDPKYSKIDQIYVLRKSKRNSVLADQPIQFDVVWDLFNEVKNHLTRSWSDVANKLITTGKII